MAHDPENAAKLRQEISTLWQLQEAQVAEIKKLRAEISRRKALDSESKYQLDKYNAELMREVGNLRAELDAERERRFEGNRIASEERREEVAALQGELDALIADVERCYRMLLSEPDTKGALFKAENILRGALAAPVPNRHDDTNVVDCAQVVDAPDEALLRECLELLENHTGNYKISKAESAFQNALVDELRNRLGDSA